MAAQDLARLTTLLNSPGVTNIPVRNLLSGELVITAQGPGTLDIIRITLDEAQTFNLLEAAPQSWWAASPDLEDAVRSNWLTVLDPNAGVFVPAPIVTPETVTFIPAPSSPSIGDLLYWNGIFWTLFAPGTAGYVLTSNGPGVLPSYQPGGGGGGGGDNNAVTGQTTTGLADGDFAYISGNNTWLKAQSDGSRAQATLRGANAGVAGSMIVTGRVAAAKFTTGGGSPTAGAEVYLAANADDGGTGAGKLTATAPSTGFLTRAGVCLDNSNYAGLKTCVVLLNPQPPIEL